MKFANLAQGTSRSGNPSTHIPLTVVFLPQIANGSIWVREELIDSESLSSLHEKTFAACWGRSLPHPVRVGRENPFLSHADREKLDENGVVPSGTILQAGNVLWSAVETRNEQAQVFSRAMGNDSNSGSEGDCSERVPADWSGAIVLETGFEESKNSIDVSVTIQLKQVLGMGDALFCEDSFLGVVSKVLDDETAESLPAEADLYVSAIVGEELKYPIMAPVTLSIAKSQNTAQHHVRSRRNGPYSLISQRPLNRNRFDQAQMITSSHARWLLSQGLVNLLAEFASLKCDERGARKALSDFDAGKIDREEIPPPGSPLSSWLIEAEFFAFGLKLEVDSVRTGQFRLRPIGREEILLISKGKVKKPETLNYRTYEGEPDGLFCPTIFAEDVMRFGHIELASPIIPYWLHHDLDSLGKVLSIRGDRLEELIYYQSGIRDSGEEWIWSEPGDLFEEKEHWLSGAEAIRALLEQVPSDEMPDGFRGLGDSFIMDVLPVLPSPIRPLVLMDSGNFATSDLNDLYRRIINRNNRIAKLIELQAPPVIIRNERRMLQSSVDALFANRFLKKNLRVLGSNNQPLKSLLDIILSRFTESIQKPVVWSAQARGIIDPQLESSTVEIPHHIFDELRLSAHQPVLITQEQTEVFVSLYPRSTTDPVIRLPEGPADRLGLPFVNDRFLSIHSPLGAEAIAEAAGLVNQRQLKAPRTVQSQQNNPDDMLQSWMNAVWHAKPLSLDPGEAALLFGVHN